MSEALPPIVARAAAHRARTAIIEGHKTYSYEDLDRASANIASQLAASGSVRLKTDLGESRVAFLVAPGFEHLAIQWGIWRSGSIAVPLPLSHTRSEVEYLIRDCEASIVIADAANVSLLEPIAKSVGAQFVTVDELSAGAGPKPCATEDMSTKEMPARRAMIVYTSGTTSRPKGVVTTHRNITAQIESLVTAWEWTATDRTLLVLPLHHVHGIINVACCALWSGAALEIHPKFDSETTWDRLASGELTVFTAVPTIYHRLIQSWEAASPRVRATRSQGCHSLRLMMSGSAALPRTVLDKWAQITGHVLLERYGMTEVGMALSNPLRGVRRPDLSVNRCLAYRRAWSTGSSSSRGPECFQSTGIGQTALATHLLTAGSGPATSPSSKTAHIVCSVDRTSTSSRAAATRSLPWKLRKCFEHTPRSANALWWVSKISSGARGSAVRWSCDPAAASS